jgi:transcriptional regulator with XRE-family HTH domain
MAKEKEKKVSSEKSLGERIRMVRQRNGLTLEKFGEKIGISSTGFLSEVERGLKIPGGEALISLKREMKVSLDWLVDGEVGVKASDIVYAMRLAKDLVEAENYSIENKARAVAAMAKLKALGGSDSDLLDLAQLGEDP